VTLLWQGVGLGDPQRSLPTPTILSFCSSLLLVCGTYNKNCIYATLKITKALIFFCEEGNYHNGVVAFAAKQAQTKDAKKEQPGSVSLWRSGLWCPGSISLEVPMSWSNELCPLPGSVPLFGWSGLLKISPQLTEVAFALHKGRKDTVQKFFLKKKG